MHSAMLMVNLALKQNSCTHKFRALPWEYVMSYDEANSSKPKAAKQPVYLCYVIFIKTVFYTRRPKLALINDLNCE